LNKVDKVDTAVVTAVVHIVFVAPHNNLHTAAVVVGHRVGVVDTQVADMQAYVACVAVAVVVKEFVDTAVTVRAVVLQAVAALFLMHVRDIRVMKTY